MKNENQKIEYLDYALKKILITGAGGFIGSHLLARLIFANSNIATITNNHNLNINVTRQYVGNMLDAKFVSAVVNEWQPDIIFHLAGGRSRESGVHAFTRDLDTNLMITLNLLFAASELPSLKRVVMIGTAEEYGNNIVPFYERMRESPVSAYSFSKQCASHLAQLMYRNMEFPVVVLRPSVVYGPAQACEMFLPSLISALLRGEEFPMTAGLQTRDFVFVADLVDAIMLAGSCVGINGEIVNIASGEPILISNLVTMVESLINKAGLVKRGSINYRIGEPMNYSLDIGKAKRILNWEPFTSLETGLNHTVSWYRKEIK